MVLAAGDTYLRLLEAAKAGAPDIHVHAFSPLEARCSSSPLLQKGRPSVPAMEGGGCCWPCPLRAGKKLTCAGDARRSHAGLVAAEVPGRAARCRPGQPAGHGGRGAGRRDSRAHLPRQAAHRAVAGGVMGLHLGALTT